MDNLLFFKGVYLMGAFPQFYLRASSMALSFTVAPLVASFPGSLPGDEATHGGAPICEGAGTHTSIVETDIKYTPCRVKYLI